MATVTLLTVTIVLTAVCAQDTEWIQKICDRVRKVDDSLVNHIQNLASTDRNDFLNDLREYVQAIRSFQTCIEQDKGSLAKIGKDILEEEGPKFYYHYDPEYIQNVLNWNESEMDECNQLKKEAVDVWIAIDKLMSA